MNAFWHGAAAYGHPESVESINCDKWTLQNVENWLRGLDESTASYIHVVRRAGLTGKRILEAGDDTLRRVGVAKESVRQRILHGVSLLAHYNFEVRHENLQRLAMLVMVSANNTINAVLSATPIVNNPAQSSRFIDVLNSVLLSISALYKVAMQMILWLDRAPFDDKKSFVARREQIAELVQEIVECVQNPNKPEFFNVPQMLVDRGKRIRGICEEVVRSNEPEVLYTAFFERVVLRKTTNCHWGFKVGCTCTGIHLVTLVNQESPAGVSGKIDAGDEVVEINGTNVVGWKHCNVLQRLQAGPTPGIETPRSVELSLLLCKRPRESWTPLGHLSKPRMALYSVENASDTNDNRAVMDFKMKIQPDLFSKTENDAAVNMRRTRSQSFSLARTASTKQCDRCSLPAARCPSLFPVSERKPLSRRASVWNESPPATLRSPFSRMHFRESNAWLLLLASWGDKSRNTNMLSAGTERRRLTSSSMKLELSIEEEDEDLPTVIVAEEIEKTGDPMELYAEIDVIPEGDVRYLNVASPSTNDTEWSTPPVQDITGVRMLKRIHLESSSSAISNVDSPLSALHTKITRFFYGEPAAESPVTLSVGGQAGKGECSTPITPIIKVSSHNKDEKQAATPDSRSMHSARQTPEHASRETSPITTLRVQTVASRGSRRLAPLAEPDEIGDLSDDDSAMAEPEGNKHREHSSAEKLRMLALAPCHLRRENALEGWLRRQALASESDSRKMKKDYRWFKSWALLDGNVLLLYENQFAKSADVAINVNHCDISTAPTVKTSKKNVFVLHWIHGELNFSPYSREDMKCWVERLTAVIRDEAHDPYNLGSEVMYVKPAEEADENSNKPPAPYASNTLPRPNLFHPTKLFSMMRQGSLSRFSSSAQSNASLASQQQ